MHLRYALRAKVQSVTKLADRQVVMGPDGVEVEYFPDKETGLLAEIRVSKPLTSHAPLPVLEQGPGDIRLHIRITQGVELYQELLGYLQYLESLMFFPFGVYRVQWGDATEEWIPESDEDARKLQLHSCTFQTKYEDRQREFDTALASKLVLLKRRHDWLTEPLSFVREGYNQYRLKNYVIAYYFFYYFLEGLYGAGKTKNKAVKEQFLASRHVQAGVEHAFCMFQKPDCAHHLEGLRKLLKEEECDESTSGLIEFIVKLRGALHHYSITSSKPRGTPLSQDRFVSAAYFIFSVCIYCIEKLYQGESPN